MSFRVCRCLCVSVNVGRCRCMSLRVCRCLRMSLHVGRCLCMSLRVCRWVCPKDLTLLALLDLLAPPPPWAPPRQFWDPVWPSTAFLGPSLANLDPPGPFWGPPGPSVSFARVGGGGGSPAVFPSSRSAGWAKPWISSPAHWQRNASATAKRPDSWGAAERDLNSLITSTLLNVTLNVSVGMYPGHRFWMASTP